MKENWRVIFFFLCLAFLLFSLMPTAYEIMHRNQLRPERAFELVHNFPTDYNFYLSRIREGIEGNRTVVEKYTSEPHEGSYIHIMYLAMGWVGGWVRVPWERGGDVYHVARVVLAMTLLLLIAEYARRSFSQDRPRAALWSLIAFLLAVTASTWPKLVWYSGGWRFGGYMPWWSVMDSLQRITFIPHLLAGQALILFLLLALSDDRVMKRQGNWIFLGLLGCLLGIIFPPGLLFVYAALAVSGVVQFFMEYQDIPATERGAWILRWIISRGVFVVLSAPSLFYLKLMTTIYPWKRLVEVDIIRPLPFDYVEYVKAVGPMLPLGLAGLVVAFLRKEKQMIVGVSWVVAWMVLLVLFRFVPQQSPLRFSEMIPHVPLGVLTAYLFFCLRRLGSGQNFLAPLLASQSKNTSWSAFPDSLSSVNGNVKLGKRSAKISSLAASKVHLFQRFLFVICHLSFVIPVALIATGVGVMYSSFLWQRDFVDHKMSAQFPLVPTGAYVMYPLKDFLGAMKFIQDNTTRQTAILSETTAGNYIPVYSGNSVFAGHDNTVRLEEKTQTVGEFFKGAMKPDAALQWMKDNNLHVVFFGPQEQEDGGITRLESVYPFLKPVFQNTFVTVYALQP